MLWLAHWQIPTVYCLMPVAVKGLLGAMEGVVLRDDALRLAASTGAGAATGSAGPGWWRILMQQQQQGHGLLGAASGSDRRRYMQVCNWNSSCFWGPHTVGMCKVMKQAIQC
jgi:hypothetical protein